MPSTFSKSGSVHFASFWLGVWLTKQNRIWGLSAVLWFAFKRLANSNGISLGKSGLVDSKNKLSNWILLKSTTRQHDFLEKLFANRGKFVLWVSPPNENRTGVFKQSTWEGSRTLRLVKTTKVFTKIDCFCWLFCLLAKALKSLMRRGSEGDQKVMRGQEQVERAVHSFQTMAKKTQPSKITKRISSNLTFINKKRPSSFGGGQK